ncbi:MAG: cobalamin-dependent protein [Verrucomicrobiae bacterium]|nr:cobalamin-dependent protein [Verrucomicrobiae bacterium]
MTICDITDTSKMTPQVVHPLKNGAKILLSSVFGPYAQDDEYGSRSINPMELYHNQVTRVQGAFSLRMFHRSWGLMLIQANLDASCTCLDFPILDRFIEEIREHEYDIVGISSIMPNVGKVRKMCELIRRYLPEAKIVVGGHISNMPDIESQFDADFVVRGDGVRWFRRYLGEDENQAIRHPLIYSGSGLRTMGFQQAFDPRNTAATLIPSVGCPLGCNFCCTSAMFGGKGKFVNFYDKGDELFDLMDQMEKEMRVQSFFIMDENFLLHRKRALRLLELMQKHDKDWSLYVFSSANALKAYTMEQLVGLGISWVWKGLEGKNSRYNKLDNTDTHRLVRNFQEHGIRVMGSSIIGLEEHSPENIDEVIEHAVSHDTEFHQFMLYSPSPGTPLYAELSAKGALYGFDEFDHADLHGQYRFNYRHPNIEPGQETEFLLRAFQRDFEANGPSVLRVVRSTLKGWKKYKNHPEARIRRRFAREVDGAPTVFAAALWAARLWFRKNRPLVAKIDAILQEIKDEFGFKARVSGPLLGPVVLYMLWAEERRLGGSWTYEPPTFYEINRRDSSHAKLNGSAPALLRSILPRAQS